MFSWFPILFPLREPVQLKADDEIVLHFWRNVSTKHVWYVLANKHLKSKDVNHNSLQTVIICMRKKYHRYEWALSSPTTVAVHNPNGRSYEIGL